MLRNMISGGKISQIHGNLEFIAGKIKLEEQGRLGDTATKILEWVDRFKGIGDVIVSFDPVHAALPWAGFRFFLQVELIQSSRLTSASR